MFKSLFIKRINIVHGGEFFWIFIKSSNARSNKNYYYVLIFFVKEYDSFIIVVDILV